MNNDLTAVVHSDECVDDGDAPVLRDGGHEAQPHSLPEVRTARQPVVTSGSEVEVLRNRSCVTCVYR